MPYPTGAIQVTGGIGTTASSDTYATHYAELGRGGLKSTQDITSRNAIPSDRREFGMEVTLLSSGVKYRLCNEDMGGVDNDKTNNSNWIEVITSIDPSNYDLTDFTNTSIDPFVKVSEVVTSVDGDLGDTTTEFSVMQGSFISLITLNKPRTIIVFDDITLSGTMNLPNPATQSGKVVKIVGKTTPEYTITVGVSGALTGKILTPSAIVDNITIKTNGYSTLLISDGVYWRVESDISNDDNTLIIDGNIIRLNVTSITEEFTANGVDRNFEMTNVYASIENVFINGVRIKSSDYITISEQEIEIKTTVTLLLGDEVVIQGTMFIN